MKNTNIDYIVSVVQVTDLEKSVDWYTNLLGYEPDIFPKESAVEW